jgi:hypothetical protein
MGVRRGGGVKELTPEEKKRVDLATEVAPLIMGDREFWRAVMGSSDRERVRLLIREVDRTFRGEELKDCLSALFTIFVNIICQKMEEDPDFMENVRELVGHGPPKEGQRRRGD